MSSGLLDLVFPVFCVGCEHPGTALCPACAVALQQPREHSPRPRPPGLPMIAIAGPYDGAVRSALLAYKERGRRELVQPLGTALAHAIWFLVQVAGTGPEVALVPVPSRRSAARARGGDHMVRLSRRAATVLRSCGVRATVRPVLTIASSTLDSAGLTASERASNVSGAMTARPLRAPPPVLVVDDLVTTGATASEACRALRAVGAKPVAAAAVAGTARRAEPPRGRPALAG